jgi:hypothetical protein
LREDPKLASWLSSAGVEKIGHDRSRRKRIVGPDG